MAGIVPYISPRPLRGTRHLAGGRLSGLQRYRVGLGALGTSDTVDLLGSSVLKAGSAVAGAAAGTAIGAATGLAAGAAAGSVVPVIGTVIGAVIGVLTSKLFGHANYAAVYAVIANVQQLWNAYAGVAGQYVGRQYGWPEIQQILHGAMVSGLFPGNGPPSGVQCTQAMISNNINACGNGGWVDDLIGGETPGTGTNNIANLIGTGLARGVIDPITMTDQVLVPGLQAIQSSKYGWVGMAPASSTNPALYRQYLIDLSDYFMSQKIPNMPAYYGTINVQPLPVAQPTAAPAPVAAPTSAPAPAVPVAVTAQPPPVVTQIAPATAASPAPVVTSTGTVVTPPTVIPMTATDPTVAAAGAVAAPVDQTASYIAALVAQGASQTDALNAAIAQLQSQGMTESAAQSTVAAAAPYVSIPDDVTANATPLATPVATTGISSQTLLLVGGAALLVVLLTGKRKL